MSKRKKRTSSGTIRRKSRSDFRQSRRSAGTSRRVVQKRPTYVERRMRSREAAFRRVARRSRDTLVQSTLRGELRRPRSLNRRTRLLSQHRTQKRLPKSLLPLARPYAIAHRETVPPKACARRKSERRAVIIARGFGGINHARKYREHTKCR